MSYFVHQTVELTMYENGIVQLNCFSPKIHKRSQSDVSMFLIPLVNGNHISYVYINMNL